MGKIQYLIRLRTCCSSEYNAQTIALLGQKIDIEYGQLEPSVTWDASGSIRER